MQLELKVATLDDVSEVLALHYRYQVDSISEEDKADGFITTAFTQRHLNDLIQAEQGLFIAKHNNKIVAYAMCASWQFWCQWPMFAYMVEHLADATYLGHSLTVDNSYQYGPVCVEKSVRGKGVFEQVFTFALSQMSQRYPFLVTFINQTNGRSFQAHTRKVKLDVIETFSFNHNEYFKLACKTG